MEGREGRTRRGCPLVSKRLCVRGWGDGEPQARGGTARTSARNGWAEEGWCGRHHGDALLLLLLRQSECEM